MSKIIILEEDQKDFFVWAVCDSVTKEPYTATVAYSRSGAILKFVDSDMWKRCYAQGYRVRKFKLVPI